MSSENPKPQNLLIIVLTVVIAFILDIVPIPDTIAFLRPEWTYLVTLYWVLALPYRVGIFTAWVVGLILDLLEANLLGLQAFTLSLSAYLISLLHQRMRLYPLYQQAMVIFLIVGLHLSLLHWIKGQLSVVSSGYSFLIPSVSSAVIWPFVALVMLSVQRRFRVQ
ncbi:rod shape-determining protein MreD [Gynuella sunshinyii]|uniref:Rod shape-determining protein MreD n=1 Tax=Gynuella sunshinyii YC6258 TaxID=1445510 RepID=A0A0C5VDA0_9GAMM|nr:rod shape-determining protein MreD [Gynuella sunshinyii]AJQ97295.1 cell shape-determining protein [Gynuella sunshinyii YC6258]